MKTKIILTTIIALCLYIGIGGCEKEKKEEKNWTSLPPETQEGKNTIGCLIDGELWATNYWVDDKKFFFPFSMYADYGGQYLGSKIIFCKIVAKKKNGTNVDIFISTPNIQIGKNLEGIICVGFNYEGFHTFMSENPYIYLTKFDTINKIISGRFSCTAMNRENVMPESERTDTVTIKVTDGRFDMKLRIK